MIKTMQDRQPGLGTSAISGALTLTKTGTTARTATFPDAAITVAGKEVNNNFSTAQTVVGVLSCQGLQNTVGDFTSRADEDAQAIMGRIRCGFFTGLGDNASFAHYDFATSSSYALRQDASGATVLNSATGQNLRLSIANTAVLTVTASAVTCSSTLSATSLTATGLTSGRPALATTGGLLTTANTFLFASSVLTIGDGATAPQIVIDGGGATNRGIRFRTGGVERWMWLQDSADASIKINAYDDTGASIDTPFSMVRAAGGAITLARPVTCSGVVTVPNGTAAAPGIRLTSEAHGLFRTSASAIGVAIAGVDALAFQTITGSTWIRTLSVAGSECGWYPTTTDSNTAIWGGASGFPGIVRAYGSTHATKAAYVEFSRGTTVSAFFDGSGNLTVNTGTVTVNSNAIFATATAASTTAGTIQRETNQEKHYAYTNGIGGWVDKCIFSQYATVSQAGVVTDQSLASATARGTRTLPANFFKLGKVLKFRLCGRYTTDVAAGNATIQIKLGATVFRTTGSIALDNSSTALPWDIEGEIVCQSTGATGTVEGVAMWKHMITGATGNYNAENLAGTAAVVIDTTAAQAFDVIWTATDAGTTLTCTCFRLWEVC